MAPESLFIDIMMNVPLIFYAARETGDRDLYELAVAHCRTTERTLVRPDGSTAHEGIFDPDTGAFLRQSTHQGLRADSSWTRGLAWSLYGFGTVFTYTHDPADLQVARRNADCFLARCPAGLVPPWDFDVPEGPDRIDDSSAAAIAASGLWNLAELTEPGRPVARRRYRHATLTILDSLCTDRYLAWADPGWEGVLKHGVYHFHKKLGVDESVMWGEFFFLEAVDKVLRHDARIATGHRYGVMRSFLRQETRVLLGLFPSSSVFLQDDCPSAPDLLDYQPGSVVRGRACPAGPRSEDINHAFRSFLGSRRSRRERPAQVGPIGPELPIYDPDDARAAGPG